MTPGFNERAAIHSVNNKRLLSIIHGRASFEVAARCPQRHLATPGATASRHHRPTVPLITPPPAILTPFQWAARGNPPPLTHTHTHTHTLTLTHTLTHRNNLRIFQKNNFKKFQRNKKTVASQISHGLRRLGQSTWKSTSRTRLQGCRPADFRVGQLANQLSRLA